VRPVVLLMLAALLLAVPAAIAQGERKGQSAAEYEEQQIRERDGGPPLAPAPAPAPPAPVPEPIPVAGEPEVDAAALIGALVALVAGIGLFLDLRRITG
jgi:hypothetical protein